VLVAVDQLMSEYACQLMHWISLRGRVLAVRDVWQREVDFFVVVVQLCACRIGYAAEVAEE
jgi:hypothetical protein